MGSAIRGNPDMTAGNFHRSKRGTIKSDCLF